ncbi:MAG: hypothetical protein U0836_20090 [Pirellulales bacterium]
MIPRIGYGGRLTIRLPSDPRLHLARESDATVWLAMFEDGRAAPLVEVVVPIAELARAIEVLSDGPSP